jgi:propanediol dehydratase small subunit
MAELTYPLSEGSRDAVRTTSGHAVSEITLDSIRAERIAADDVRVSPDTLRLQADFAEQGGNSQLAANLRRGAELCTFTDDKLLEFYELLRPGRATAAQMDDLATRLEVGGAPGCAVLVREAQAAYVRRGLTA